MKPNGYTLWQSSTVSVVATGFRRPSTNPKTGHMIQTYIINRHVHPVRALYNGKDSRICGDCPLRPANKDGCYVVHRFVSQVWKAHKAGNYPLLDDWTRFNGKDVRLGSYGDPAFVPIMVWKFIAANARSFTGYTHQWRWADQLKPYCMASCTTVDQAEALARGWRTYTMVKLEGDTPPADSVNCPASEESEHSTTCSACRLCGGTSKKAKSVWIYAHGWKKGLIK